MHVDTGQDSVNFSCEKFLLQDFLEFVGNGIGMPVESWSLEIQSHREFPGNAGSILPK